MVAETMSILTCSFKYGKWLPQNAPHFETALSSVSRLFSPLPQSLAKAAGVLHVLAFHIALTEQQRDAPDGRKAYQGIYYPADGRGLTAKEIGHQVKAKKAYQAPV
jgi:hypothetical protein